MNAQTWLHNHYWLFLLEYFFPPRGGLGPKGCVGHTPMVVIKVLPGILVLFRTDWLINFNHNTGCTKKTPVMELLLDLGHNSFHTTKNSFSAHDNISAEKIQIILHL